MKILIASGAPWSSTDGAQRYQQLVTALRQIGVEADFYCPYSEPNNDINPFPASEEKDYDFFICGIPDEAVFKRQFRYRRFVVDVCDKWDSQMVAGKDFSAEFHRQLKMADFVIAASPMLQALVQTIVAGKPTFLVPNGVREEVFMWKPRLCDKPIVAFWAAAYTGQEWWDLETIFELPRRFPQIQFRYYFASDREFHSDFPNLSVKVAAKGVPFSVILEELTLPAIGLVPFSCGNPVAWHADSLKIYEYAALGMTVVATNAAVPSEVDSKFSAFGDTRVLLPMILEKALEYAASSQPVYSPERFRHWSWRKRAEAMLSILEMFAASD